MELADVTDSKSVDGDIVWVRVPPPAPNPKDALWCFWGLVYKGRDSKQGVQNAPAERFVRPGSEWSRIALHEVQANGGLSGESHHRHQTPKAPQWCFWDSSLKDTRESHPDVAQERRFSVKQFPSSNRERSYPFRLSSYGKKLLK